MRSQSSITQRIIALGIVISFSATSVFIPSQNAYAAPMSSEIPSENSTDLSDLKLPKSLGEVEEIWQGNSQSSVILIRDAHSIPDAQKNIEKIIELLAAKYGINQVGVEGASEELDAQIFRSFPDQKHLKEVIDGYAEKGELAGSAMAAILGNQSIVHRPWTIEKESVARDHGPSTMDHGLRFFGLEDWSLYGQGVDRYLDALGRNPELVEALKEEQRELREKKEKLYSSELLEIDKSLDEFYDNHLDFLEILKRLGRIYPPSEKSELGVLYREAMSAGKSSVSLEIEVKDIARELEKALRNPGRIQLPKDKNLSEIRREFNAKRQAFQTSQLSAQDFALFLNETAQTCGLAIDLSKKLKGHVSRAKTLRDIEGSKLMKEFEKYADAVKSEAVKREASNPSVRLDGPSSLFTLHASLESQTKELRLKKKLINLELTREEWKKIREELSVKREAWGKGYESNMAFYLNAEDRDQALFKNYDRMLALHSLVRQAHHHPEQSRGARSPLHSKSTILVAGGFHTEGLVEQLKEKGISYLLIRPAMQTIPDHSLYQQHMRGEVSWSNYFEVEDGKLDLYKAFVRATRDQLISGIRDKGKGISEKYSSTPYPLTPNPNALPPAPTLKLWRDQIIRDMAKQNDIARAGEYTRFIDEAAGIKTDPKITQGLARLDKFIDGLKKLYDSNQVTQQNILNILRPATISTRFQTGGMGMPALRAELRNGKIRILPFGQKTALPLPTSGVGNGSQETVIGPLAAIRDVLPIPGGASRRAPREQDRPRLQRFPAAPGQERMQLASKSAASKSVNPADSDITNLFDITDEFNISSGRAELRTITPAIERFFRGVRGKPIPITSPVVGWKIDFGQASTGEIRTGLEVGVLEAVSRVPGQFDFRFKTEGQKSPLKSALFVPPQVKEAVRLLTIDHPPEQIILIDVEGQELILTIDNFIEQYYELLERMFKGELFFKISNSYAVYAADAALTSSLDKLEKSFQWSDTAPVDTALERLRQIQSALAQLARTDPNDWLAGKLLEWVNNDIEGGQKRLGELKRKIEAKLTAQAKNAPTPAESYWVSSEALEELMGVFKAMSDQFDEHVQALEALAGPKGEFNTKTMQAIAFFTQALEGDRISNSDDLDRLYKKLNGLVSAINQNYYTWNTVPDLAGNFRPAPPVGSDWMRIYSALDHATTLYRRDPQSFIAFLGQHPNGISFENIPIASRAEVRAQTKVPDEPALPNGAVSIQEGMELKPGDAIYGYLNGALSGPQSADILRLIEKGPHHFVVKAPDPGMEPGPGKVTVVAVDVVGNELRGNPNSVSESFHFSISNLVASGAYVSRSEVRADALRSAESARLPARQGLRSESRNLVTTQSAVSTQQSAIQQRAEVRKAALGSFTVNYDHEYVAGRPFEMKPDAKAWFETQVKEQLETFANAHLKAVEDQSKRTFVSATGIATRTYTITLSLEGKTSNVGSFTVPFDKEHVSGRPFGMKPDESAWFRDRVKESLAKFRAEHLSAVEAKNQRKTDSKTGVETRTFNFFVTTGILNLAAMTPETAAVGDVSSSPAVRSEVRAGERSGLLKGVEGTRNFFRAVRVNTDEVLENLLALSEKAPLLYIISIPLALPLGAVVFLAAGFFELLLSIPLKIHDLIVPPKAKPIEPAVTTPSGNPPVESVSFFEPRSEVRGGDDDASISASDLFNYVTAELETLKKQGVNYADAMAKVMDPSYWNAKPRFSDTPWPAQLAAKALILEDTFSIDVRKFFLDPDQDFLDDQYKSKFQFSWKKAALHLASLATAIFFAYGWFTVREFDQFSDIAALRTMVVGWVLHAAYHLFKNMRAFFWDEIQKFKNIQYYSRAGLLIYWSSMISYLIKTGQVYADSDVAIVLGTAFIFSLGSFLVLFLERYPSVANALDHRADRILSSSLFQKGWQAFIKIGLGTLVLGSGWVSVAVWGALVSVIAASAPWVVIAVWGVGALVMTGFFAATLHFFLKNLIPAYQQGVTKISLKRRGADKDHSPTSPHRSEVRADALRSAEFGSRSEIGNLVTTQSAVSNPQPAIQQRAELRTEEDQIRSVFGQKAAGAFADYVKILGTSKEGVADPLIQTARGQLVEFIHQAGGSDADAADWVRFAQEAAIANDQALPPIIRSEIRARPVFSSLSTRLSVMGLAAILMWGMLQNLSAQNAPPEILGIHSTPTNTILRVKFPGEGTYALFASPDAATVKTSGTNYWGDNLFYVPEGFKDVVFYQNIPKSKMAEAPIVYFSPARVTPTVAARLTAGGNTITVTRDDIDKQTGEVDLDKVLANKAKAAKKETETKIETTPPSESGPRSEMREETITRKEALAGLQLLGDEVVEAFKVYVEALQKPGKEGVVSADLETLKGALQGAIDASPAVSTEEAARTFVAYLRAAQQVANSEMLARAEVRVRRSQVPPALFRSENRGASREELLEMLKLLPTYWKTEDDNTKSLTVGPSTGSIQISADGGWFLSISNTENSDLTLYLSWSPKEGLTLNGQKMEGFENKNPLIRFDYADLTEARTRRVGQGSGRMHQYLNIQLTSEAYRILSGRLPADQIVTPYIGQGPMGWRFVGRSEVRISAEDAASQIRLIPGSEIQEILAMIFRRHKVQEKDQSLVRALELVQGDLDLADARLAQLPRQVAEGKMLEAEASDFRQVIGVSRAAYSEQLEVLKNFVERALEERLNLSSRQFEVFKALIQTKDIGPSWINFLNNMNPVSAENLIAAVSSAVKENRNGIKKSLLKNHYALGFTLMKLMGVGVGISVAGLMIFFLPFSIAKVFGPLVILGGLLAPFIIRSHEADKKTSFLETDLLAIYSKIQILTLGRTASRLPAKETVHYEAAAPLAARAELRTNSEISSTNQLLAQVLEEQPLAVYRRMNEIQRAEAFRRAGPLLDLVAMNQQPSGVGGESGVRSVPPSSSTSPVRLARANFLNMRSVQAPKLFTILGTALFFLFMAAPMTFAQTVIFELKSISLNRTNQTVLVGGNVFNPNPSNSVSADAWIIESRSLAAQSQRFANQFTNWVQVLTKRQFAPRETRPVSAVFPANPNGGFFQGVAAVTVNPEQGNVTGPTNAPAGTNNPSASGTNHVTSAPTNVTLAWSPSPDASVIGYALYYGVVGENLTNRLDVGNSLTASVPNLIAGKTYFFFATAYDANRVESEPSNLITYTPSAASGTTVAVPMVKPLNQSTNQNIVFSGTRPPDTEVLFKVNGGAFSTAVSRTASTNWSFSYLPPAEGRYDFTFAARDAAGHQSQAAAPVSTTYDVTPPQVSLMYPSVPVTTTNSQVTVQWTVDGGSVQSRVVPLSLGTNSMTAITATDPAGNSTVKQVPPIVRIPVSLSETNPLFTAGSGFSIVTSDKKTGTGSGSFSSTNAWVSLTGTSSRNLGSNNFTISAWIKPAELPAGKYGPLFDKWEAGGKELMVHAKNNAGTPEFGVFYTTDGNTAQGQSFPAPGLFDGAWHLASVTRSNGVITLSFDGRVIGSYTVGNTAFYPSSGNWKLGSALGGVHQFMGGMDEVSLSIQSSGVPWTISMPFARNELRLRPNEAEISSSAVALKQGESRLAPRDVDVPKLGRSEARSNSEVQSPRINQEVADPLDPQTRKRAEEWLEEAAAHVEGMQKTLSARNFHALAGELRAMKDQLPDVSASNFPRNYIGWRKFFESVTRDRAEALRFIGYLPPSLRSEVQKFPGTRIAQQRVELNAMYQPEIRVEQDPDLTEKYLQDGSGQMIYTVQIVGAGTAWVVADQKAEPNDLLVKVVRNLGEKISGAEDAGKKLSQAADQSSIPGENRKFKSNIAFAMKTENIEGTLPQALPVRFQLDKEETGQDAFQVEVAQVSERPDQVMIRVMRKGENIAESLLSWGASVILGRERGVGVWISDPHSTVSRRHMEISFDPREGLTFRDLGSTRGTKIIKEVIFQARVKSDSPKGRAEVRENQNEANLQIIKVGIQKILVLEWELAGKQQDFSGNDDHQSLVQSLINSGPDFFQAVFESDELYGEFHPKDSHTWSSGLLDVWKALLKKEFDPWIKKNQPSRGGEGTSLDAEEEAEQELKLVKLFHGAIWAEKILTDNGKMNNPLLDQYSRNLFGVGLDDFEMMHTEDDGTGFKEAFHKYVEAEQRLMEEKFPVTETKIAEFWMRFHAEQAAKLAADEITGPARNVSPETAGKLAILDIREVIEMLKSLRNEKAYEDPALAQYAKNADAILANILNKVVLAEKESGNALALTMPEKITGTERAALSGQLAEAAVGFKSIIDQLLLVADRQGRIHEALRRQGFEAATLTNLSAIRPTDAPDSSSILSVVSVGQKDAAATATAPDFALQFLMNQAGYNANNNKDFYTAKVALALMLALGILAPGKVTRADLADNKALDDKLRELLSKLVPDKNILQITGRNASIIMTALESFIQSYRADLRVSESA